MLKAPRKKTSVMQTLFSYLFRFKNNTNKSLCKQSLQRDLLVLFLSNSKKKGFQSHKQIFLLPKCVFSKF